MRSFIPYYGLAAFFWICAVALILAFFAGAREDEP